MKRISETGDQPKDDDQNENLEPLDNFEEWTDDDMMMTMKMMIRFIVLYD